MKVFFSFSWHTVSTRYGTSHHINAQLSVCYKIDKFPMVHYTRYRHISKALRRCTGEQITESEAAFLKESRLQLAQHLILHRTATWQGHITITYVDTKSTLFKIVFLRCIFLVLWIYCILHFAAT